MRIFFFLIKIGNIIVSADEAHSAFRARFALHKQAGFTIPEIEETIRTSPWMPAELGRLDCRKNFSYGKEWNGKVYATQQVRPIFVEEAGVPQAEFTERSRRQ